jgi:hypothetical protein
LETGGHDGEGCDNFAGANQQEAVKTQDADAAPVEAS